LTRYAVVGNPRSGTSMLMRAIDEGGIPAHRDRKRDDHAVRSDLSHNPHGFYEVPRGTFTDPTFPSIVPDGSVIKVFLADVERFCQAGGSFRVALLRRDPSSVGSSYEALFGRPAMPSIFSTARYEAAMAHTIRVLSDAASVLSITELDYDRLVEEPAAEFERLVADGWPIDVATASRVPTDSLRHHIR